MIFCFSCTNSNNDSNRQSHHKVYSLVDSTNRENEIKKSNSNDFIDSLERARKVDSLVKQTMKNAMFDTVGLSLAPVKVLKSWFTQESYSSYKDIALTYKNVSAKKITAIRFRWYGETAFGDPADMGTSLQEGFGGGFMDDIVSPGRTRTSEWSILSRNGKKVILAWPTEVMFADGTKWEIGK